MDVRKKKWLTYFVAFCMTLSVLTGIEPTQFLLHAATGPHKPVVTNGQVTFSITTPGAYAVYLAGDLNGWQEKDLLLNKEENDLWTITLSTADYEKLMENKSGYKFVTYTEEDGQAHWEDGANHLLYREGFEFTKKDLNAQKGELIDLPGGVYYDEAKQEAEEIGAKDINYQITSESTGLTLTGNQLQIPEDFEGRQITIKGTYKTKDSVLNICVTSGEFSPVVIEEDGRITFNVIYSGKTLYYVGTLTSWGDNQKEMKEANGIFTYTTENPVDPGIYEYKFKPNADNWDDSFNAEGGTGNSKVVVPGILKQNLTVEAGKTTTLPATVNVISEDGTNKEVAATYTLKEEIEGVTLQDKVLSVSKTAQVKQIQLEVTAGELKTLETVNVVSELYTYTINYMRPAGDYNAWNLWLWYDGGGNKGYEFNKGLQNEWMQATYEIETQNLSFIVRKGEWEEKDVEADRKITIPADQKSVEVWLVQGDSTVYYSKPDVSDHVLNAFMDNTKEITVNLSAEPEVIDNFVLKDSDGKSIETTVTKMGETCLKLTVQDESAIDVRQIYTVSSPIFKEATVTMRGILDDTKYYYDGDDLGLTYSKSQSTFKVWAPTATDVKVAIYDTPEQSAGVETSMTRTSSGVWEVNLPGDQAGKYYMYAVSFADGKTNYAVDPYAKAVSINGTKAAIVDLNETDPSGFNPEAGPRVQNATDAVVYEVHVRDFSSQDGNGFNPSYRGKYLAFTEKGLTTKEGNKLGIDHLKELGITHVQLQPIYDYATVDEVKLDSYNWGYDPQNFNVPEGSYATDPSDPSCRIKEAKAMIKALHDEGIGVIMDVVYNHTYNIEDNPFNKVVPGYYYRSNAKGSYTNGSGCGNEVASERPMVRKFIKDSAKYWATEYGMDGFRFDLMGLIDTETMKQVTKMLQEEVNPNIIVYGEPWTGGTSGLSSESQTLKGAQKNTDFGVFNDNIRGAIKGDSDEDGKGFATGSTGQEKDIIEGVQGAIHTIAANPKEMVTYITAHDNLNLWDKVLKTMHIDATEPYATLDMDNLLANEAVKRDLLANGIVFTSQGISFIHAGEEILRTKYGDHNSYKSPDKINQIVWQDKDRFKPVFDYYQGLIALRKAHPAFRMATSELVKAHFETYQAANNVVAFGLKDYANGDSWKNIVVVYNASEEEKEVNLPQSANWQVVVNEEKAGTQTLEVLENASSVKVAPLSMMVLYDTANNYVPEPTTIAVEDHEVGMAVNQSKLLKVSVKDQNGALMANQKITYTSSDEAVVTVTQNGKLTANQVGEAVIHMQCDKASLDLKVKVVAELVPSKMVLSGSKPYVYETRTLQLTALVYDQFQKEMLGAKVKWSTSDKNIASVDAYGKVTGIREGQAVITATIGKISENYTVYVKSYEKRYIVIEYIREDKDYTDWNLWTWSTGVTDGQVDFTVKDGKATALIEIGPDTESVGFIVRKGTDWSTCKQDISADRYIMTPVDQVITKAKIYEMVQEVSQLEGVSAPVIKPETKEITFYYSNNELFKTGKMDQIEKVVLELNGEKYDMIYDNQNERFIYTYKGLQEGKYYYCYHVTMKDGTVKTYLDPNNLSVENNQSVLVYKKYNLEVAASVTPSTLNARTSSALDVAITSHEEEDVAIKKIVADLSQLGGASDVSIDPTLHKLALSVSDTIVAGKKQIPIKVYDTYGNVYETQAEVEVATATQSEDFDWDEAVIYFMLTDRFNNGDTSNDDPFNVGYDKTKSGTYHGGDFKGITNKLDYLKDLGINTIWISPIVEQINHNIGNVADPYYAYHGYWAKDFEKLNPHFGSLEDLKELIDAAHERGIKIMVDVVINHAGYGLKEGETGTDPNFPSLAEQLKYKGMFRTDGKEDTVYGEVSGLPDFITEDPQVRQTVLDWQSAWIEKCTTSKGNTIDYFRVDTAKHVDKATLQALKLAVTKVKPDFKYILEAWYSDSELAAYLNRGYGDGVLNFDFKTLAKKFTQGQLEEAENDLEALNDKVSSSATYGNFLGSHDEDGFLYIIGKDNIGGLKNAITLQATSKGQPVIYYGEEIGLSGANNYPQYDNRYDMKFNLDEGEKDILAHYQKVLGIRKAYSKVFAKGTRKKLAGSNAEGFIAFSRSYNDQTLVTLVNQKDAKEVTLTVPFKANSTVNDLYSQKTYTVSDKQTVTLNLPAAKAGGTVILTGEMPQTNQGSSSSSNSSSKGSSSSPAKTETAVEANKSAEMSIPDGYIQISKPQEIKASETATITLTKEEIAQIKDSRKVGVYYVEANNTFKYVGGKLISDTIQFNAKQTGTYIVMAYEKTFTDVKANDWAKEYIEVLAARHILCGKTEDQFVGHAAITRAEFAVMLGRMLNVEENFAARTFKDVKVDSWYAGYVNELEALGLITGYSDHSFKPNKKISRAEMAVILVRAYHYTTGDKVSLTGQMPFKDGNQISEWALEGVIGAYELGLIEGMPNQKFLPNKTATRAETAKMLFKLLEVTKAF